jgi:hypothetical protein
MRIAKKYFKDLHTAYTTHLKKIADYLPQGYACHLLARLYAAFAKSTAIKKWKSLTIFLHTLFMNSPSLQNDPFSE